MARLSRILTTDDGSEIRLSRSNGAVVFTVTQTGGRMVEVPLTEEDLKGLRMMVELSL